MNIVHQEGLAMPVDQELINIILNEAGNPPPHKAKITAVSLLFKDLSYSAEKGGYHPVEIRIISRNDEWYFDYITDFHHPFAGAGRGYQYRPPVGRPQRHIHDDAL